MWYKEEVQRLRTTCVITRGIKKKYKDYVQLALLLALYYITLSSVYQGGYFLLCVQQICYLYQILLKAISFYSL